VGSSRSVLDPAFCDAVARIGAARYGTPRPADV
jgi:hypothetical protein